MEEAVRRELLEEVNLKSAPSRYHATPALAVSVIADAGLLCRGPVAGFPIDGNEIEDARWLTKDEARQRLANEIEDEMKLPATIAIAHHLIRDWA